MTPAGSPVEPSDDRGAPALLPILAVAASLLVGLAGAVALGGVAWVVAGVVLVGAIGGEL